MDLTHSPDFAPARRQSLAADRAALRCEGVDLLDPLALDPDDRARWTRLSQRSGGSNGFALDWFMEPALRLCGGRERIRLAAARQADGEWLGALPLARGLRIGRAPVPHWRGWQATNQFLGAPLIAQGGEETFWTAMLGFLDARPGQALALMCEGLAADDPACLALVAVCAREGRRLWVPRRFDRPARLPHAATVSLQPPPPLTKARARLASLERRLARDMGEVRIVRHPAGEDCEGWIARFLALESAGWKGGKGSALACDPCNAELFRETVRAGHANGAMHLASLEAGGRTLAMTSWIAAGSHRFGFKMAHDEAYRRHAPGRILMRAVAEQFEPDSAIVFDTCTPGGASDDPFWPERREIVDVVVAVGSRPRRALAAGMMRTAALWRGLRSD